MAKYIFEWDDVKDVINQKEHSVSFADAQEAFYDTHRIIGAGNWRKWRKFYEKTRQS